MPQDLLQQRAGSQRGEGGGSSNIVHQKILKYSEIKNKSQYKHIVVKFTKGERDIYMTVRKKRERNIHTTHSV